MGRCKIPIAAPNARALCIAAGIYGRASVGDGLGATGA
jgi:hypothetical protein